MITITVSGAGVKVDVDEKEADLTMQGEDNRTVASVITADDYTTWHLIAIQPGVELKVGAITQLNYQWVTYYHNLETHASAT